MHVVVFPVLLQATDENDEGCMAFTGPAELEVSRTGVRMTTVQYRSYTSLVAGGFALGVGLTVVLLGAVAVEVNAPWTYGGVAAIQTLCAAVLGSAAYRGVREWCSEHVVVDVPHDQARGTQWMHRWFIWHGEQAERPWL
jgi:hypothetical protein